MSELLITRVLAAPREQVWRAWTEPEVYKRWWGPKGFTSPMCKIDLRVGGTYINSMLSPDGQESWGTGEYRDIKPMERLVMTDQFANAEGKPVPASHYGLPGDWPAELLVMVDFADAGRGQTRLTVRHEGLPDGEMRRSTEAGWNESLDKLAATLQPTEAVQA